MIDPTKTTEAPEALALALAETLLTMAGACLQPHKAGNATFMVVPPGYTHQNISDAIERSQLAPNRKRGTAHLGSLDSLIQLCADQQAAANAYIYADPDARVITAVFDDSRDRAGWREHRAIFAAEYTPEFRRWIDNNGADKAKGQTEFAEFIEDNLADITEPSAQQLLEVATTLQAKTDINFQSAKRLDNGQNQITYVENINATAGANGALTIPKEFALGVRIFKNGEGYKLKARLKYRLVSGGVKFWYELDRPERAVEDAFAGYITTLRDKTGYTVLIGKA